VENGKKVAVFLQFFGYFVEKMKKFEKQAAKNSKTEN